jgi:hypothetical protein
VARISWDAFNETGDLIELIEPDCNRFGHYPEFVHADKIYRSGRNRKFCKKHGIRLLGPALGRPPASVEKQRSLKQQARQNEQE